MADLPSPPIPAESLYVHVPFCARKCAYCAFYSEVSSGEWMNRYVSALLREMEFVAADLRPVTVFFGGGTPSLLTLRQWESILHGMERLRLLGAGEWTVECNPATVSWDKAQLLREYGVNRISLGVQSLDESLLERLGRIHTRARVFESFDLLRKAGFDNVNLDLMFAVPGQTLESWRQTLTETIALGSEHLSCYEVIYEEDTPLFAQLRAGEFRPDEDLAAGMYEELLERAEGAGLRRYEIANFARDTKVSSRFQVPGSRLKPGKARIKSPDSSRLAPDTPHLGPVASKCWSDESPAIQHADIPLPQHSVPAFACRHNVNYWRGGPFHGLGPSATSYVRGVRTQNSSDIRLYCEQLANGCRAIGYREELSPLARAGETAAFGLRMVAGWPFDEFRRATGHDLRQEWSGEMSRLAECGWGSLGPDRFQLTPQGLRFADAAAELFLR
jgi:oxygen-independent coproporphyrinogen-3 oxidase